MLLTKYFFKYFGISPKRLKELNSINDLVECYKFRKTLYGYDNLLATVPRSGFNWLMLNLNIAYNISNSISYGDYEYISDSFITELELKAPYDYRTALNRNFRQNASIVNSKNHPIIFHTHKNGDLIPNNLIRKLNGVILVRNIYEQLLSRLYHRGYTIEQESEFLKSNNGISSAISFYNTWGKIAKKNVNFHVIKYEDLLKSPFNNLNFISKVFNINLSEYSINQALLKITKEEMMKKMGENNLTLTKRMTYKKEKFSRSALDFIQHKVNKEIKYNLGYDL